MTNEQTILDIEISEGKQIDGIEIGKSVLEDSVLDEIEEDYCEGEGDR